MNQSDVHLVFDPSEAALAEAVRYRLREHDLTCDDVPSEVVAGEDFGERVRESLESSEAFVFLMSKSLSEKQTMLAEAGAAWAADKPIFLLMNDVRISDYSPFFKQFPAFRLWSGFSKFVRALQQIPERASV